MTKPLSLEDRMQANRRVLTELAEAEQYAQAALRRIDERAGELRSLRWSRKVDKWLACTPRPRGVPRRQDAKRRRCTLKESRRPYTHRRHNRSRVQKGLRFLPRPRRREPALAGRHRQPHNSRAPAAVEADNPQVALRTTEALPNLLLRPRHRCRRCRLRCRRCRRHQGQDPARRSSRVECRRKPRN